MAVRNNPYAHYESSALELTKSLRWRSAQLCHRGHYGELRGAVVMAWPRVTYPGRKLRAIRLAYLGWSIRRDASCRPEC